MQHLDFQLYINILNCGFFFLFQLFNYNQTRNVKSHILSCSRIFFQLFYVLCGKQVLLLVNEPRYLEFLSNYNAV